MLHTFVSPVQNYSFLDGKTFANQFRCTQFRAISRIFNCFLVRNYSTISRNEMVQAEAIILAILRNGIPIGTPNSHARFLCREQKEYIFVFINFL